MRADGSLVLARSEAPHRLRSQAFGRAVVALLLLLSEGASAYCISTTCDPKKKSNNCGAPDSNGCYYPEGAKLLHWDTACLSFGVQQDGSKRRHISYEQADVIIRQAFDQWTSARCPGGQSPSIKVWDMGPIVCDKREFNETEPNSNTWIFRDDAWPYNDPERTLAFTSQIYDVATGAILDADVEINSRNQNLTAASANPTACGPDGPHKCLVDQDLQSIATHEAGHFLGLAHSIAPGATMQANYNASDLNFRSISPDDTAGICKIYPPDRDVPECSQPAPVHGFSRYCGTDPAIPSCRTALGRKSRPTTTPIVMLLGALAWTRRRRRCRRARGSRV